MKKTLMIAAALSALTISSTATALDVNQDRSLRVQAFGSSFATLGSLSFVALGAHGNYCQYLAAWESPYNPNDVQLCVLDELRTRFTPSCIHNESCDITTTLTAGHGSFGGCCAGFNIKGEAEDDVELLFTEGPLGIQGVVIVQGYSPVIYPVLAR